MLKIFLFFIMFFAATFAQSGNCGSHLECADRPGGRSQTLVCLKNVNQDTNHPSRPCPDGQDCADPLPPNVNLYCNDVEVCLPSDSAAFIVEKSGGCFGECPCPSN